MKELKIIIKMVWFNAMMFLYKLWKHLIIICKKTHEFLRKIYWNYAFPLMNMIKQIIKKSGQKLNETSMKMIKITSIILKYIKTKVVSIFQLIFRKLSEIIRVTLIVLKSMERKIMFLFEILCKKIRDIAFYTKNETLILTKKLINTLKNYYERSKELFITILIFLKRKSLIYFTESKFIISK